MPYSHDNNGVVLDELGDYIGPNRLLSSQTTWVGKECVVQSDNQ